MKIKYAALGFFIGLIAGCGAHSHLISDSGNIGTADSTSLQQALIGRWKSDCSSNSDGSNTRWVYEFDKDGTFSIEERLYDLPGCKGHFVDSAGSQSTMKFTATSPNAIANGDVQVQALQPVDQLNNGAFVNRVFSSLVSGNRMKMQIKSMSMKRGFSVVSMQSPDNSTYFFTRMRPITKL